MTKQELIKLSKELYALREGNELIYAPGFEVITNDILNRMPSRALTDKELSLLAKAHDHVTKIRSQVASEQSARICRVPLAWRKRGYR